MSGEGRVVTLTYYDWRNTNDFRKSWFSHKALKQAQLLHHPQILSLLYALKLYVMNSPAKKIKNKKHLGKTPVADFAYIHTYRLDW
jgi:hypothetical protein